MARCFVSSRNFRMLRLDAHSVLVAVLNWRFGCAMKCIPGVFIIVSEGILFPIPVRVHEFVDAVGFFNTIRQ